MPTAEVETHTPPPVEAPPPEAPPKLRIGRRAAAQQQSSAEESSAEEQLTYFQQQAEIPEVDWERTCQYLYRWQPFYDNTKGGIESKYVCLYTTAITIDQIKREHGSGRYQLKLNQRRKDERSDKTIRQIVFDILDPAFPPNLPDGDWKTDLRNKKWVWGKAEPPQAGPQGSAVAASVKEIQALVQTLYPNLNQSKSAVEAELVKILPALLEQRNGQQMDPLAMVTAMVTLIKTMAPAPPAPVAAPPADNTMTQFLLKQIESMDARTQLVQQQFIELLKQKSDPVKQPDAMDMLDRMAGIFGKVSDVRESIGGGSGASRMNGWQEVASNVGTELIKAVGPVLPFMLRGQPRPAATPQRAVAAAPGAVPNPAQPAPAAAPTPAAPAPVETMEDETMDAASFLAQQMQNLGIIGPMLTYFNDGETGLRFAMWIADGHGAMPLNLIKGQGKSVVLRAVAEHLPQLYAQLQPNWGKFDLFVDSFLTWTPDAVLPEDQEDDEEEDDQLPVGSAPPTPVTPNAHKLPITKPPVAKKKTAKKKVAK